MLSTTWTAKKGAFSPLLFSGLFDECLKVSKQLGVKGVELSIKAPDDISATVVSRKLKEYEMAVSAVGTGLAYMEDGLSFSNHSFEVRQAAITRFKGQVRFAATLNAPVILGLIHGNVSLDSSYQQKELEWIYEATRIVARYAYDSGTNIVIEPINRYETNLLNTIDDVLSFIETVNEPNLGIMIDTFHMNIEESSLYGNIKSCKELLQHVHLADSNRMVPGYGHLDFNRILNELKDINYDRYISLECIPKPDPITASTDGVNFINAIIN